MSKMKNKILLSLTFIVLLTGVCLFLKSRANVDKLDDLNEWAIEIIMTNYVDGEIISETDIVIDQIYYGSFSEESANEILVISKILNTPHAAGLDKTATILLSADSLELIAYKEFGADKVALDRIQTSNGQSRVIVTNTMIYQGIASQVVALFSIDGGEWNEVPIDFLVTLSGEYYCFIADELLIVASKYCLANVPSKSLILPEDVIEVLDWDPYTEQFIVPDSSYPPF